MSNFDLTALAIKSVCPTNDLIFDDTGMPSVCVYFPKMKNSQLFTSGSDSVHDAFIVNGQEIDGFWYDKYQGVMYNNRLYSLPGEDPKVSITYDQGYTAMKNKGGTFHMATVAERAFITLWCLKNGYLPNGNSNYGKDNAETVYTAIPANYDSDGRVNRVLTGTGPVTWRHNGQEDGVCDLKGNVWEQHAGARLVYGEIQILANNDAADTTNSIAANSAQWKAINQAGELITPNGLGTTPGSLKIDWVANKATIVTEITVKENAARSCQFKNIVAGTGITIPEILKRLGLFPIDEYIDLYGTGYFYFNNGIAEAIPYAGGCYYSGSNAWVGSWHFCNPRSYVSTAVGVRGASLTK